MQSCRLRPSAGYWRSLPPTTAPTRVVSAAGSGVIPIRSNSLGANRSRYSDAHVRSAEWTTRSSAGEHQRALDLLDGLVHPDAGGAGVGAVERGAAAPDAVDLVEDVEPLCRGLVAAVEDEAVRVDDGRRTEVAALVPEHRATGGARRAQDALGGVVVAGAVGLALNAFPRRGVAAGDQVWLDRAIGVEERLHVDDQVLLHRQSADRLDRDGEVLFWLGGQQKRHQPLPGHPAGPLDPQ